jgi:hypothetical protein
VRADAWIAASERSHEHRVDVGADGAFVQTSTRESTRVHAWRAGRAAAVAVPTTKLAKGALAASLEIALALARPATAPRQRLRAGRTCDYRGDVARLTGAWIASLASAVETQRLTEATVVLARRELDLLDDAGRVRAVCTHRTTLEITRADGDEGSAVGAFVLDSPRPRSIRRVVAAWSAHALRRTAAAPSRTAKRRRRRRAPAARRASRA